VRFPSWPWLAFRAFRFRELGWARFLRPCASPELPSGAWCGDYEIFEDRAAKRGRKIPLHMVVLPASGEKSAADPVFLPLPAGPSCCCPARWTRLPRTGWGRGVTIPKGGHGEITSAFIARASVKGLDTSCLEGIRRPPFVTTQG